jgi:AcrR family transcriptional regulator
VQKMESETASIRELKQDRSIDTRARLVQAAIQVLSELGYAGFSTMRVAKAAGVSRGALQYHFESRESLLSAARLRLAEAMSEKLAISVLNSMPLPERVDAIVDNYWEVIGSTGYIAALEIRLYERFNRSLHELMAGTFEQISRTRDQSWIRIFSDSPLPTEDLILLRRFMLDGLRGAALRQLEGDDPKSIEGSLKLLRQTLVTKLSGN